MPQQTSLGLSLWDFFDADRSKFIDQTWSDMMGIDVDSNMNKINNMLSAALNSISALEGKVDVLIEAISMEYVEGGPYDYYVGHSSSTSYVNNQLYITSFDRNNTVGKTVINIGNIGDMTLKKVDSLGNLVDLDVGDIIKNVLYLFTVRTDTNSLVIIGKNYDYQIGQLEQYVNLQINQLQTEITSVSSDIDSKLIGYLSYNGDIAKYSDLPTDNVVGDIWNVINGEGTIPNDTKVMWNGSDWTQMGGAVEWIDILNKPTTFEPSTHTQDIDSITGLQNALNGKASTNHNQSIDTITGLQNALDGKASSTHTQAISTITGLQTALDSKANSAHTQDINTITGLQGILDGKASSTHTQAISTITGLQSALDGKASSTHTQAISTITGLQTALDEKIILKTTSTAGEFDKTNTDPTNEVARINFNGNFYATNIIGANWNDYAEYRKCIDKTKPGMVIIEVGDDTTKLCNERLEPTGMVISDTFGFSIGKTSDSDVPVAVSGRVLAYTDEDRNLFNTGDCVCTGSNGTVSKMTRDEITSYPDRIIGIVSSIPSYERWGTGNVFVDNRIWIKIK